MARNCKLATKLRTIESTWEMWRVPQPNVEIRRSLTLIKMGGREIMGKKFKEIKEISQKLGRQNLAKNFRNRNMG